MTRKLEKNVISQYFMPSVVQRQIIKQTNNKTVEKKPTQPAKNQKLLPSISWTTSFVDNFYFFLFDFFRFDSIFFQFGLRFFIVSLVFYFFVSLSWCFLEFLYLARIKFYRKSSFFFCEITKKLYLQIWL